jgi:hypothetical protein
MGQNRDKRKVAIQGGLPCRRCGHTMQRFEHSKAWKAKEGEFFACWDICRSCGRIQHYEEAKMKSQRDGSARKTFKSKRVDASCGVIMQRWRHGDGWVPEKDRGYYERWDQCRNAECKTQMVTSLEFFRMCTGEALASIVDPRRLGGCWGAWPSVHRLLTMSQGRPSGSPHDHISPGILGEDSAHGRSGQVTTYHRCSVVFARRCPRGRRHCTQCSNHASVLSEHPRDCILR